MTKLVNIKENEYSVHNSMRRYFKRVAPVKTFHNDTVKQVFNFAYGMTFGGQGAHKKDRSGGDKKRKKGEIFASTYQGKLAECAVCNLIYEISDVFDDYGIHEINISPDFNMRKLNEWDSGDVNFYGVKISVKSTKSTGHIHFLEYKNWDENGIYKYPEEGDDGRYDLFFLARIEPDCGALLRKQKLYYSDFIRTEYFCSKVREELKVPEEHMLTDEVLKQYLYSKFAEEKWQYDIPGFITLDELAGYIQEGQFIQKGAVLNRSTNNPEGTIMDADNYYVLAGDMHPAYIKIYDEQSRKDVFIVNKEFREIIRTLLYEKLRPF